MLFSLAKFSLTEIHSQLLELSTLASILIEQTLVVQAIIFVIFNSLQDLLLTFQLLLLIKIRSRGITLKPTHFAQ